MSFEILVLETFFGLCFAFHLPHTLESIFFVFFIPLCRTNNLTASLQNQIQSLRDSMNKAVEKENALKKLLESKNEELQEKSRTITQVKKIGRRYKTQYDELKVDHDKVRASQPLTLFLPNQGLFYSPLTPLCCLTVMKIRIVSESFV